MDAKKVNAAVDIRLSLYRMSKRQAKLEADLQRLLCGMFKEEYEEYKKRVA